MERINYHAPRLWFLGIVASLLTNLHRIQLSYHQRQVGQLLGTRASKELISDRELKKVCKDALQDLIDLVIPLSLMGWVDITPGTVGLAGAITSLMGASSLYPRE